VEELGVEREAGRGPVFQVTFGMHNVRREEVEIEGLRMEGVGVGGETARYDLTAWMEEEEDGIRGSWWYRRELYERSTIKRMQEHFKTLLESIVAEPETRVKELRMMSEAEIEEQAVKERELARSSYQKFKSMKPRSLNISDEALDEAGRVLSEGQ
jgi:non-ribosomal peptide synthetase component F